MVQPELDETASVRQVVDEPTKSATDWEETFWELAAYQMLPSDTAEPGLTLDQFEKPYTMTMTQAGFAQLSPADKSAAIDEIIGVLRQARSDTQDTCARADADIACGNYDRAEIALVTELERLHEFNCNGEGLYLTRIMGISYQQTALKKLETLYTWTEDDFKLQTTRQRWQDLEGQKHHIQRAQMEQAD
jgi:hypothetical protein